MNVVYSIFPKSYPHLSLQQLAGLVREVGLDTTNIVIRNGFWVTPEGMAREAPACVKTLADEGITVRFATAGFEFNDIIADPTPLKILADCGVRDFRPAYFQPRWKDPERPSIRTALDNARATMEKVAEVCLKTGTRCVYQVHHGSLLQSASAAWQIVKDLPPSAVGIELDPGNQVHEGWENWRYACELLGDYVAAAGVKDVRVRCGDQDPADPKKGWWREWAPCDKGIVNWHEFASALASVDFDGTFVFMPFYKMDDPDEKNGALKREVAYVRNAVTSAVAAAG
jgi:sugar phosphate isomerase/epimerase